MTTITDEMLSAFIDGELCAAQADEVRLALNTDPALRAQLARFERADATIREAASALANRQMPRSVLDMLSGNKVALAPLETDKGASLGGSRYWPTALAASIALVIGWSMSMFYQGVPQNNSASSGSPIAALAAPGDPLFIGLETTPSGQSVALSETGSSIQPVLSFASTNGELCREFITVDPNNTIHAIACRERDAWRIDFAIRSESTADKDGYQTASASDAVLAGDYIAEVMAGDAFGRAVEADFIAKGWRSK